ncbi:MAG: hypothetical protein ACE5JL_08245, partial [Dehalococcoidia bacterium]
MYHLLFVFRMSPVAQHVTVSLYTSPHWVVNMAGKPGGWLNPYHHIVTSSWIGGKSPSWYL